MQQLIQESENRSLKLPFLPDIASTIRDAVANENAPVADIARLLASDAALSVRIIQLANHPSIGGAAQEIDSLEKAVKHLGLPTVRDLVFILVMEQMFRSGTELIDKKLGQLWEHSTTVSAICHALAAKFTTLSPVRAMLAGLIHDIGYLPILSRAEDYPELLENEAELDVILTRQHARIGTALLEDWKFPVELIGIPAEHGNLQRQSSQTDYIDVVTVANLQSYLGNEHPLASGEWSNIPAFARLGLSPEVNVLKMEETAEDIREVQCLLNA